MDYNQSPIETEPVKPHSWYKKLLPIILVIIVLAGAAFAYTKMKNKPAVAPSGEAIQKREVSSTDEEKQKLEAKVADYEQQIQALPADSSPDTKYKLYLNLASSYYGLGKYDQAIATLDKIIGENQDKARLWALYANIYRDMDKLDKARENAKKALDLDKENPAYWLAYIDFSADQSKQTIDTLYQDALKNTDTNIDVVVSYAKFLENIGNKEKAKEFWVKAGQIDAKNKAQYDAEIARIDRK